MMTYAAADNDALDYDAPPSDRDLAEARAFEDALAEYQAAQEAAAAAPRDWNVLDRLHRAGVDLQAWWDHKRYGAIDARVVAEILAEREERRR